MNYSIINKVIALPLSTAENSIAVVLAYHVQKDSNSCFPSYKTINKESGASNKTISKVIRTLKYAGVIDYKHRAQIGTNDTAGGKESNEYFFMFEGIGFYRNKLTKEKTAQFKASIKEARKKATADMNTESRKRKEKRKHTIPSQMLRNGKPQNVKSDACNVAGLEGVAIPSHFPLNTSQMLRRSNRDNVQAIETHTKDTTIKPCNKKNQKTVLHEESNSPVLNNEHDSQINTLAKQNPSSQSNNEWLIDYDNA